MNNSPSFKLTILCLAILHCQHTFADETQTLETIELHASDLLDNVSSEQTKAYIVKNSSSASKLNLSVKETPQTVNVVTRQQMDDFGLSTTRDVLKNTPGVTISNVETERSVYMARGFEISNILNDGVGSPATSYNYNNINPDTYLFDRIEVIKGADALTNAFGDPSATVDQIRKRTTQAFQANAGIILGSWNKQRYEADVSGPLSKNGNVRGRVLAFEETRNSYLDRYSLEKNGFSGVLEADLSDRTLLTVGFSQEKNDPNANNWGALPLLGADGKQLTYSRSYNPNPNWAHWDYTKQDAFFEIKQKLSENWNAKLTYNYTGTDHRSHLLYYFGNPQADGSGVNLTAWGGHEQLDTHIFDLNTQGTFPLFGQNHEAIIGYSHVQSHQKDQQRFGTINDAFVVNSTTTNWASWTPQSVTWTGLSDATDSKLKTDSVYAATRLHLNDDLRLILGANYVQAKNNGISYGDPVSFDNDKVSPYAGLTYNFSPEYTGYLSYTSIFRPQIGVDIFSKPLKPIDGKSYEIGVKSAWFDDKFTGSLAIFKTEENNYPLRNSDGQPLNRKVETSDLSAQGVEVGLAGQLTEHFNVSLGYAQFSLRDKINGGKARTYNPDKTFNLLATYAIPALPQLKIGTSIQWQDDISLFDRNVNATIRQDAYALVNLMASYELNQNISLQVNANNITNEKYLFSFPDSQAFYGEPSNYNAAIKFKY